jgi:uncharacterized protein YehS (DUF1456 family)
MNNNDILRRLRYTFDISDNRMIDLFASGGTEVTRAEISDWMKPEDHEEFQKLVDINLAAFLNGFINDKRGQKEGEQPKPEKSLNNNIILRKLKIALNYKDEDILDVLDLVKFRLSESELSAFFRKPDHQHYRPLKDQILRNFLLGLQLKHRPESGKQ